MSIGNLVWASPGMIHPNTGLLSPSCFVHVMSSIHVADFDHMATCALEDHGKQSV